MRFSHLLLLSLIPLAACNSTDFHNAVEVRFAQSELDSDFDPADEPEGLSVAFTSSPRVSSDIPVGFEVGVGRQEDDALPSGDVELENLWAGAFVELGEKQVRPFFGVGAIRSSVTINNSDAEGFGLYVQGGLRAYANEQVHLTLGYRTTYELDDTVLGNEVDLDSNQIFFGVGIGF